MIPLYAAPTEREEEHTAVTDFLSGASTVMPLDREREWEAAAEEQIEAGREALESVPGDYAGWQQFIYGAALKRGINYAYASRMKLMALGAHSQFREIYEGARHASDADLT